MFLRRRFSPSPALCLVRIDALGYFECPMASRSVRQIGWLVAADIALILFLFAFGLALSAMKIPMEGHPFLTDMLGAHGLIFGVVLPLAIYLLIPAVAIWIIAWIVSSLRKAA